MSHSAKQQAEQPETLEETSMQGQQADGNMFLASFLLHTTRHFHIWQRNMFQMNRKYTIAVRKKRADSKHVLISFKSLHLSALLVPRLFMYVGVCGEMETR